MPDSPSIDPKTLSNYAKYASRNPLFRLDHDWIRSQDPYVALASKGNSRFDFRRYYLEQQQARMLISPNPFFDWIIYDKKSNYLARKGRTPIEYDFMTIGLEKNITPHWLFSNQHYPSLHSNFGQSSFTEEGLQQIRANYGSYYLALLANLKMYARASPIFSMKFYRKQLGEPSFSHRQALRHYLAGGHAEGVHGSPLFDEDWYTTRYGEGLSIGSEPHNTHRSAIEHFLTLGVRHGLSPIPDFDAEFYLKVYPYVEKDVATGVYSSPIDHFLGNLSSGPKPNPYFDPFYYLEQNPDVAKEMDDWGLVHPLEHFLHAGYARGYRANQPLLQVAIPENYAKAAFEKRQQLNAHQYMISPEKSDFTPDDPDLSLVIPVSGHFTFTASLLAQIALQHGGESRRRAQVIVVDNGSHDRTVDLPALFPGVTYIRVDEPIGYTAACAMGARAATAPVMVFLNNDIELGPGVLGALVQALEADPGLGAVGPKIVLTDGAVQEAGGVVFANGGTAGFGRGAAPERDVLNVARDVDFVSGCALAVRRNLYEEVGGFDEQFSPGYFEDVDLCLRLWSAGHRVRYLPHAYITHYEYGTYSKGRPKEISAQRMYANKAKFVRKHRRTLEESGASITNPDVSTAAFRRGGFARKFVLFVEDLVPSQLFGSGFVRSEDVVREFLDRGWRVTAWAGAKRAGDEPFREKYRGQVDVRYMENITLPDLLKEIGPALSLAWVCRTHNIANYRGELLEWRQAGEGRRLVADTEALASLRNAFLGMPPSEIVAHPKAVKTVRAELKPAVDFDAVVCVNGHEARLATSALESACVRVLGHRFGVVRSVPAFGARKDFVFCGAIHETNSPNMDSLRWFCDAILPLIRERIPDAGFSFVGYVRDGLDLPREVEREARIIGRVDDLGPVFDQHRVFVAPTRIAAGVPHKVQQAMALGLPCVVTRNLAEQLEISGNRAPFLTAVEDPAEFAEQCVALHADESLWRQIQAEAWTEIEREASAAAFSKKFGQILVAIGADEPQTTA